MLCTSLAWTVTSEAHLRTSKQCPEDHPAATAAAAAACRRESTTVEDLFYAHISGMDALARGLRNAAALKVRIVSQQSHNCAVEYLLNSGYTKLQE